ncbi:hypothetical protein HYW46_04480 [Candidatus Daviesbacteria bacterium]|nr:hypothetical protein [Candidatus Daviesbacteria bacterium]
MKLLLVIISIYIFLVVIPLAKPAFADWDGLGCVTADIDGAAPYTDVGIPAIVEATDSLTAPSWTTELSVISGGTDSSGAYCTVAESFYSDNGAKLLTKPLPFYIRITVPTGYTTITGVYPVVSTKKGGNVSFDPPTSETWVRITSLSSTDFVQVNFFLKSFNPPGQFIIIPDPPITVCRTLNQPEVRLSWTQSANVDPEGNPMTDYYEIFRSTSNDPSSFESIGRSYTLTFWDSTGTANGVSYYYRVVAHNKSRLPVAASGIARSDPRDCSGPQIVCLRVEQAPPNPPPTFSGTAHISGNQPDENGLNWLNPIRIKLVAKTGDEPITESYVAFYNQLSPYSDNATFLGDVQNTLINDPKKGFLLAFGKDNSAASCAFPNVCQSSDTSYVFDPVPKAWISLNDKTATGYNICTEPTCKDLLYTAAPVSLTDPIWKNLFYKKFASKNMFTAAYVKNSLGSTLGPDLPPLP